MTRKPTRAPTSFEPRVPALRCPHPLQTRYIVICITHMLVSDHRPFLLANARLTQAVPTFSRNSGGRKSGQESRKCLIVDTCKREKVFNLIQIYFDLAGSF